MQLQLEDLPYQSKAIQSAVKLFNGQGRNVLGRDLLVPIDSPDIMANSCVLTVEQLHNNKLAILKQNALPESEAALSDEPQVCIEMETGTGKTLVYIRTLYELYQAYGYSKFIIVVPSIAIKEGIINTLESFAEQLKGYYQHNIRWFEYDSKRLNQLKHFVTDDQPQIMLTTLQAFTAEDRILNQKRRDDSIDGLSYLEALGQTRPIIVMDEPQEGMDTDLAQKRLDTLKPLFVFRYSATHKRITNRLYRLTPYEAYAEGLVKKIEVLSVAEINDEAVLKIELQEIQAQAGQSPKAKLNLWHNLKTGFVLKPSKWLKVGDNLGAITNNISYQDFTVERIYKGLRATAWTQDDCKDAGGRATQGAVAEVEQRREQLPNKNWKIHFSNGVEIEQNRRQGDIGGLFRQQLYWLIDSHFNKQQKLSPRGIKCLSLVFIDKVDNYLGAEPLIKQLFAEEYQRVHQERTGKQASPEQIAAVQGYYFARTGKGEFTDNESTMLKNREIYDLILKDKQQLLSLDNPVEFIFSHSALGVGWDNPNIFNIATLNQTYSEIKKRQEKCIYIDPPYNTGKDFVYSDNYNEGRQAYWQQTGGVEAGIKVDTNPDSDGRYHSNWLNMIYPRLLLARQLLKDDGVIFVSIDDNEVHNLRKVMDEVFGEENFLACVCWQKKYAPSNDTEDFSPMHDFIVVYCKQRKYTESGKVIGILRRLDRTEEQNKLYKNPDNDPRGIWASDNYLCNKTAEQRPNLYYPIIHPQTGEEIWPSHSAVWRYSKERHELNARENRIWWGAQQENTVPRYKRFLSDVSGVIATTWWTHQEAGHNDGAK